MRQGIHWCIATGAALTVSGLIVAVPVQPALPDVQVREADLTAANALDPTDPSVSALYDHVQQETTGNSDFDQVQNGLADLTANRPDLGVLGASDTSPTIDGLSPDQSVWDALIGSTSLNPTDLPAAPEFDTTAPSAGFEGGAPGGVFTPADQGVNSASTVASLSLVDFLNGLPAAYQTFTDGVVTAELAFNQSLVDTQVDAVQKLFTDYGVPPELLNTVFGANNTMLVQIESALNNVLSANVDDETISNSLVGAFNNSLITPADLAAMAGFDPGDSDQFVQAIMTGNLLLLLNSLDLPSWLPSLF